MANFIQVTLIARDDTTDDAQRNAIINTACIAEIMINHNFETVITTNDGFQYKVEEGYMALFNALNVERVIGE